MKRTKAKRPDIYARITNQIVGALERGVKPWTQPWNAAHAAGPVSRPLRHGGQPYAGINVVTLWATAMERSYSAPIWMTFRQAMQFGGHVRKGEKGAPVVYADKLVRSDERSDGKAEGGSGDDGIRVIPFLKSYTVFNVEQIDGLPQRYYELATAEPNPDTRIANAEAYFAATGADIREGGNAACYIPALDVIHMPPFEAFRDAQGYYSTLAHECTHWTRHESRLNRDFGRKKFGDAGYAREELVAELGAAFLCADLGITLEDREDHAAYIGSWLQVLKSDSRAIFTAAAHAQKAVSYLHGLQPNADGEADTSDTDDEAAA